MKLKLFFILGFLFCAILVRSTPQNQQISGTVTDSSTGNPLPGVNIIVEGTQTGTSTDLNGKFILPKLENGSVITFSFIGYRTEKVTYSGQVVLDVKLVEEITEIEEVVVTGYGTQKKSDLTGSISTVSSKDIDKVKPHNIESALQGRIPGLTVTSFSGSPGSDPIVRIRGIGTVNNNDPIYVVDGMLINNHDPTDPTTNIKFLNPADIASIEVLKDASSQAIYGSRGANGVILISTRKGTEGAPRITFNASLGIANVTRMPKVLDATGCKDYILTSNYNGYIRIFPDSTNVDPENINETTKAVVEGYNKGINTNWLDEVTRKNVLNQNYDLSISGGTKYSHYLASAGYLYTDGLIEKYDYKRYAFRLNTDYKVGNFITIGENLGVTSALRNNNDYAGPFQSAMWAYPMDPVLKPEGEVDPADPDYEYNKYAAGIGGGGNPALEVELQNWQSSRLTLVGNIFAELSIFKDLKFRTSWGFNNASQDISDYNPEYYLSTSNQNTLSKVSNSNTKTNGWVWENTFTYNKIITNHSITALIGYTSEYAKSTYQSASKSGTPNNTPEMRTFDAATTDPLVSGGYNENSMVSLLARINYTFRDKYLLTASVRRDGSSKFSEENHWGVFPSFSLGWRIINEQFFRNLSLDFISNLKLRAGWGQIGNQSLPVNYGYVSQVASTPSQGVDNRYIFGGVVWNGYSLSTIGNPDLSWETTQQTNFGLEIGFMKNSLSITADYYIKNTNDMLLQVPAVYYSGYSSMVPYTNAGSVQNRGVEIVLNWQGKSGDFSYGLSLNGSSYKNEVTSLGLGDKPLIYGLPSRTEVGSSIGRFYGFMTDGIFQTEDEVQSYTGPGGTVLQPDAHAGDMRFRNLNNDESIDINDKTWIGSPLPKLTYGFNLNLGYKSFDMILFFQGSHGNDIYKIGIWRALNFEGTGNMIDYIYNDAWTGEGSSNSDPILSTVNDNDNFRDSNYFLENGSYLRLKNLQFGYNFPKTFCDRIGLSSGRVWIGGTNLLTFTKYRGIDPEVDFYSQATTAGYDWNNLFPQSKEISLGVTISF
jgi:TonB-dependent starch-binding outer membrane protein SusC